VEGWAGLLNHRQLPVGFTTIKFIILYANSLAFLEKGCLS